MRIARFVPRRSVPLIAALALAGVVVGAATAAMTLGPPTDTPRPASADAPSAAASSSAAASRGGDERASRSGLRADPEPPSGSPSAPPSPAAPTKKATIAPSQPSGGGSVVSSGRCGASYYSGGTNADGSPNNPNAYTAAHKTLPFGTRVKVTNPANGKSVVVVIRDRGPYVSGRCLDLTPAAFGAIASLGAGVITVDYQVLS